MAPKAPPSKSQLVYRAVRAKLLGGGYAPGQRLVIESLARELKVSPVPVREAIRMLEAEGWLTFQPNVGAELRNFDPAQWVATMELMAILEGAATAMAAPHMRPADIAAASACNTSMKAALEDYDMKKVGRSNREFHFSIYRRCTNEFIVSTLTQTWDRQDMIRDSIFQQIPLRGMISISEHNEILALIEAGAPHEQIEQAARAHKLNTIAAYQLREEERGA